MVAMRLIFTWLGLGDSVRSWTDQRETGGQLDTAQWGTHQLNASHICSSERRGGRQTDKAVTAGGRAGYSCRIGQDSTRD